MPFKHATKQDKHAQLTSGGVGFLKFFFAKTHVVDNKLLTQCTTPFASAEYGTFCLQTNSQNVENSLHGRLHTCLVFAAIDIVLTSVYYEMILLIE